MGRKAAVTAAAGSLAVLLAAGAAAAIGHARPLALTWEWQRPPAQWQRPAADGHRPPAEPYVQAYAVVFCPGTVCLRDHRVGSLPARRSGWVPHVVRLDRVAGPTPTLAADEWSLTLPRADVMAMVQPAGFSAGDGSFNFEIGRRWRWLSCPTWAVAALAVPVAGVSGRHLWVARRRRRLGRCCRCGYDLRASPNRCPECGGSATRPRD